MSLRLSSNNYHCILIISVLAISAFTHLWNAAGFPDVFFDEGAYMHRAIHVLKGLGPEEGAFYDHPFFGQIFLAGVLGSIGYPHFLNLSNSISSVSMVYLIPRILMGVLAVVDTFLVYKIADKRYGKNVALISAVLFSVMPTTWIFRRILLDSILLPFLLLSILSALHSKDSKHGTWLVLLSGICMGLAIFTKVPAFTMIPLVGSIVFLYNRKRLKMLGLWLLPVIMIPLAWPALGLGIFGVTNLVEIITTDMTSAQYTAMSYILNDTKYTSNTIIFAGPTYSWVLDDVFHKENTLLYYSALSWSANPNKFVLVSDPHFHFDPSLGKQLVDLYNSTHVVSSFDGSLSRYNTSHYPYQNLYYTTEGDHIEIRVK